ncbi:MAG: hypothetical protein HC869_24475, partial [Rhodospirillales bacterium]|nr:hypothetical protein [Rhodospirillales bacterium]
ALLPARPYQAHPAAMALVLPAGQGFAGQRLTPTAALGVKESRRALKLIL